MLIRQQAISWTNGAVVYKHEYASPILDVWSLLLFDPQLINHLETHGITEEGILRVPGSATRIKVGFDGVELSISMAVCVAILETQGKLKMIYILRELIFGHTHLQALKISLQSLVMCLSMLYKISLAAHDLYHTFITCMWIWCQYYFNHH